MKTGSIVAAVLIAAVLAYQAFGHHTLVPSGQKFVAPFPVHCDHNIDPEAVVNLVFSSTQPVTQTIYTVPEDSLLYVTDYLIAGRLASGTRLLEDVATVQTTKIPQMRISEGEQHLLNGSFKTPIIFAPDSLVIVDSVSGGLGTYEGLLSGYLVPASN